MRECISFRIGSAHRRVDRFLNRAFARIGLTHAHGQLLAYLLAEGELRVTDLSARSGFEQSTVSRLVRELSRRRLVRRRKNPEDGRSQLWSPARRGLALRDEIEALLQRANDRLRRDLPDADLTGLLNASEILDRLP